MRLETDRSFTITEAMVAVALFTFLMTGLFAALSAGRVSFNVQSSSLTAQREARSAINNLSRELRMVDNITVTSGTDGLMVTFTHPADGSVSYTWTSDASSADANRIIRSDGTTTRTLARNISALSVTDNTDNVVIAVTATGDQPGPATTIQLVKKVAKRE